MAKAYLIYSSRFIPSGEWGGRWEIKIVEAATVSREIIAQKLWRMAEPYFQEVKEKYFLETSPEEARRITERDLDTHELLHWRRFHVRIGEIPAGLTPSQG